MIVYILYMGHTQNLRSPITQCIPKGSDTKECIKNNIHTKIRTHQWGRISLNNLLLCRGEGWQVRNIYNGKYEGKITNEFIKHISEMKRICFW